MDNKNKELAELLFKNIDKTPEYYEQLYPIRNLQEGSKVTRFAPSPTGFIHIGGLFASLVSERLAHQSKGVFFLRIEDTDKKREVEGGVCDIIESLKNFDIQFDEGALGENGTSIGQYGPYKQSERVEIYQTFAKYLVEEGYAYPCFCSEEKLETVRKRQEDMKIRSGYYAEWAVCRNLSFEEIKKNLEAGMSYVLRLKSPGSFDRKVTHRDAIRGKVEMPQNDQDIVLLKSDGIPTYHFAHAVDDHLMRTTHVIRGDEWLSSVPLHVQLFQVLGWQPPVYAHISPIMKKEDDSKRKLSKRKDPEAAVMFYHEQGYPSVSVIEYLLNIANSNFENWRRSNLTLPNTEFPLELDKMSKSGALFDIVKLTDISRDLIALMKAEDIYIMALDWAKTYDTGLAELMSKYEDYTKRILDIERNQKKPRKDIAKWNEVRSSVEYFYDELFNNIEVSYEFPENISHVDMKEILTKYKDTYNLADDKQAWFDKIRDLSEQLGFAKDMKAYKENPEAFKGNVGDVSSVIRVALTGRKNSPDLYEIMQVYGQDRINERLDRCIKIL